MTEKVTKDALPERQEADAQAEQMTSGNAGMEPVPYVPSAEELARWEANDRRALRLRALELAVQMFGKQAGRTFDVLTEADRLLDWVVGGSPAQSAD